jgi:queuine/archaeosine tRNA-ribosyltransferase
MMSEMRQAIAEDMFVEWRQEFYGQREVDTQADDL